MFGRHEEISALLPDGVEIAYDNEEIYIDSHISEETEGRGE